MPEKDDIEFKTAARGVLSKDIWESVTAFSNADGGQIVFGVSPNGGLGNMTPAEVDKLQRSITTEFSDAYSHKIYPEIGVNRGSVTVYVPAAPAALRPIFHKRHGCPGGARVRVGSSNLHVDDEWMRRFAIAAAGGAETVKYKLEFKEVLDQILLDNYINQVNKVRGGVYEGLSTEEILRKLRVIENGYVTLFGLLAFSKGAVLQEVVSPTVNVAITQYRGASKSVAGSDDPFYSNKEFYGPVTKQFEEAYKYLLSSLPIKGTIDDKEGRRRDYYEIPEKAIREVLANALSHRDYSVQSSRVQIDIYSDRIEFINPGRSLVPIDKLDETPSMSRNPILMSYLKDMGYTEQRARGIKTIKESIKSAGLIEPEFKNLNGSFVAVLYSSAFISSTDKKWLNQFSNYKLNERQLNTLAHLKNSPQGISNKEHRELNGMDKVADDKKANRDLRKLASLGLILKAGEGAKTRYYIGVRESLIS